jgi:hypothetical protein
MVVMFVAVLAVAVVVLVIMTMVMIVTGVADDERVLAGRERIRAGPFERILRLEKLWIELGGAAEIESAHVEHAVEVNVAIFRAMDPRDAVDSFDSSFEGIELGGRHEIRLVEQDHVGKANLLHGFVIAVEMLGNVFRVDDGHDRVEPEALLDFVVSEKRLRHGGWIRHASRLDQNAVQLVFAFQQPAENTNEIAANTAADAAVVHLEQLFLALNDQLMIDADFAEFVFNHGELFAVVLSENPVEERGFSSAEEASENGDGNHCGKMAEECETGEDLDFDEWTTER